MARDRSKIVGTVTLLALVPMAAALTPEPTARADVLDDLVEGLFAPFLTAAGAVDPEAAFSPAAWDSFLSSAHWDAALTALADPGPAIGIDFYTGLHDVAEQWINSSLGGQVDGAINQLFGVSN